MTAQIPIDHHFTPVFYLKAWAGEDGRVIRYSRPKDIVVAKSNAPSRTGSEPHLYTLQGVPPERQAWLETEFFSPVDARAATAHAILLKGGLNDLTQEERCDWARFMMSMHLRSPFSLGEVARLADQTMRATMQRGDAEFEAIRKPNDPKTIYDWTAKYEPHVIENAHKTFLPGMIDQENLGRYLVNMVWATIDVSAAPYGLLTGDRPFIYTFGWKDPRAVLLFPLSPGMLFVATNGPAQILAVTQRTANDLVRSMNDEVAWCAVEFVIGRDRSQLRFVERRLRRADQDPIPGPVGKGRPGCPT